MLIFLRLKEDSFKIERGTQI